MRDLTIILRTCGRVQAQHSTRYVNKPDIMLFSLISGLAFHIMDSSGKDLYLDFDALWNSVPELWK